jgi:hypothetical protein
VASMPKAGGNPDAWSRRPTAVTKTRAVDPLDAN